MKWYLKHEEHGYKIAYDRTEYEGDLRRGWTEYDLTEREAEIRQKVAAKGAKNPDAGTFRTTGETVTQTSVPPVKRKYQRRTQRQEVAK